MSPPSHPASGGVARALWTLATPLRISTVDPTHAALRYRAAKAWGIAPLTDVYLPTGPGPHRSVIVIHGGGFLIGSRQMKPVRYIATRLVEAGFAVATLDYRMLFRGGRLSASVADVSTMRRWWRDQGNRFNLDTDQIATLGFSAGATLMWLSAAEESQTPPSRLVSLYGLYDFSWLSGRRAAWLRRRLLGTRDVTEWRSRSPLAHALCPSPAMLIHGGADQMVPVAHAEAMDEVRRDAELDTTLRVVEGARHGFLNDASSAVAEACVAEIVAFLSAAEAPSAPRAATRSEEPTG